jgi:hypothetical protein
MGSSVIHDAPGTLPPGHAATDNPAPGERSSIRKVVFVCASLQASEDGVSDYCYRLSEALCRLGVDTALLALADRYTDRVVETQQEAAVRRVQTLRLPARLPPRERASAAAAALARWQPDWISLHLVPYGFNAKGILLGEQRWMPPLFEPYRRHVMLHELWVGREEWSSWKDDAVGALQRWALLGLLRRLSPSLVHTSTPQFQKLLRRHGVEARLLRMFGAIPVSDRSAAPWLPAALQREGVSCSAADRERSWLFGIFGGIGRLWPAEAILSRLGEIATRSGRRAVIVSIGRTAPETRSRFEQWRQQFPEMAFAMLGPHSTAEISEFLNSVDFCLTSYPFLHLPKSSTAAAAAEHGVPVITSWGYDAVETRSADADPLFWLADQTLEQRLLTPVRRRRVYDAPEQRARQILEEMAVASLPGKRA